MALRSRFVDSTAHMMTSLATRASGWNSRRRLHFVQDVATPHNNALLRELETVPNVNLVVEYAHRSVPAYPLAAELVDEIKPAVIYGSRAPSARMIAQAVFRPRDRWLLVAWSNPTTRALIVWFWVSRRRYNCWIDVPPPTTRRRMALRNGVLHLLRSSRVQMFAVGSVGVTYLVEQGFSPARVHNLPVAVSHPPMRHPGRWRTELGVSPEEILLVTGSRLTYEKGFDVLIRAVASLDQFARQRLTTVIVGRGPEKESLIEIARQVGLSMSELRILDWLPGEEFAALVGDADLVAHPSRSDSYGGTALLARVMGKPLVASRGSGASVDVVRPGVNGWLYEPEDTADLATLLERVVMNNDERANATEAMQAVSMEGSPHGVAAILLEFAW